MTKEELEDLKVVFGVARKAFAQNKDDVKALIILEEKLFKELEDGSLQSPPNKRTRGKKSN